jgi:hypothetical protein
VPSPRWLQLHLQSFLAVQPPHALGIDNPALPPPQYVDWPIAVAGPCLRDFADAFATRVLLGSAGTSVKHRSGRRHRPECAPDETPNQFRR